MDYRFIFLSLACLVGYTNAEGLNLAQTPLEVPQGVDPNIMIIIDDSGSMDWEIMTPDLAHSGNFFTDQPDGVSVPGAGSIKHNENGWYGWPCQINTTYYSYVKHTHYGYLYGVEFESNNYHERSFWRHCYIADAQAWRFRTHQFNPLYYNPKKTYEPWPGLSNFKDASGKRVPYSELVEAYKKAKGISTKQYLLGINNPFNPTLHLDLNAHAPYEAGHDGSQFTRVNLDRNGDGTPDGFRYYNYIDTDNDGIFENSDQIEEVLVRTLDADQQRNFQNWFNFYRSRQLAAKGAMAKVVAEIVDAKVGYVALNKPSFDKPVKAMRASVLSDDKLSLLDSIAGNPASGGTPLREKLDGVGKYYACDKGNVFNLKPGSKKCPIAHNDSGMCQQNYALLFTDGLYKDGGASGSASGNVDRDLFTPKRLNGGAFADRYTGTLADIAQYYYQVDLKPRLPNLVPVTDTDLGRDPGNVLADEDTLHQNMKTYTVAFGLPTDNTMPLNAGDPNYMDFTQKEDQYGNITHKGHNPDLPIAWVNPDDDAQKGKIQDLIHTAYNGRGYFFAAHDYADLANSLSESFNSILTDKSGAAALSFNSQELDIGDVMFRAFYNPSSMSGDITALEFGADGRPDVDHPKWSASKELQRKAEAAGCDFDPKSTMSGQCGRLLVTWNPRKKQGAYFKVAGDDAMDPRQIRQFERRKPEFLPPGYGGEWDRNVADERVEFLWGDRLLEGKKFSRGELRERDGLLGDFANSTPAFVGSPPERKRNRPPYPQGEKNAYQTFKTQWDASKGAARRAMVYAGANDGMLHGFDANSGEEVFGYLPNMTLSKLYRNTLPGYVHQMSVDGSPVVEDVFLETETGSKWRTVLIGGLRAGGRGYYALDVTDPNTFTQKNMLENVMWEFDHRNDRRLGHSFSQPTIVMTNAEGANGEKRWAAIFGNGYNHGGEEGSASLFITFIDAGLDGRWRLNRDYWVLEVKGEEGPNGLGTPRGVDADGNGTMDYVYAGDLHGNLYRFDTSSTSPGSWAMSSKVFEARNKDGKKQPITTQPLVTRLHLNDGGATSGFLVAFTSGSWMTEDDAVSTETQSIYGVWDTLNDTLPGYPVDRSYLVKQEFKTESKTISGKQLRTLSGHSVPYILNGSSSKIGWFIDLDACPAGTTFCAKPEFPGERAVRNLILRGKTLLGATILPSSNAMCSIGPGGWIYAIDIRTGGAPQEVVFDLSEDGSFDSDDKLDGEVPTMIRVESGLPSDLSIIKDEEDDSCVERVCYQTSTGKMECEVKECRAKYPLGRLSWKELFDSES